MSTQRNLLLVEDEGSDALLIKRALEKTGANFKLSRLKHGEEAIDYLTGVAPFDNREMHPLPDVILLDIKLPRRTGFEVLEWVREKGPPLRRIPVVIVSSSDNPSDINQAYELGANAYMVKPMDYRAVEHLFQSITQYWGLECAKPELEAAGNLS